MARLFCGTVDDRGFWTADAWHTAPPPRARGREGSVVRLSARRLEAGYTVETELPNPRLLQGLNIGRQQRMMFPATKVFDGRVCSASEVTAICQKASRM